MRRGRATSLVALLVGVVGLVLIAGGVATPGSSGTGGSSAGTIGVVVTSHAVPAGATLSDADVSVARTPSTSTLATSLLHATSDAVGRRVATALPAGAPLFAAILLDPATPEPGHRLVRLTVDGSSLAVPPVVGQLVDVVAAIVNDQSGGGHVVVVTTAKVVAVAGSATLTLDVDPASAERLLWAESFAKTLRVLPRPPGDDGVVPMLNGLA